MNILIIDGQGGKLGKLLCEELKKALPSLPITAVGTNSIATAAMQKGGADRIATGENPVVVACRTANVIIGPVGIVIADSLLGEITPKMAYAVGSSDAKKILIPMNKCNTVIAGTSNIPFTEIIGDAVSTVQKLCEK